MIEDDLGIMASSNLHVKALKVMWMFAAYKIEPSIHKQREFPLWSLRFDLNPVCVEQSSIDCYLWLYGKRVTK